MRPCPAASPADRIAIACVGLAVPRPNLGSIERTSTYRYGCTVSIRSIAPLRLSLVRANASSAHTAGLLTPDNSPYSCSDICLSLQCTPLNVHPVICVLSFLLLARCDGYAYHLLPHVPRASSARRMGHCHSRHSIPPHPHCKWRTRPPGVAAARPLCPSPS